jgi:hypothetical protein
LDTEKAVATCLCYSRVDLPNYFPCDTTPSWLAGFANQAEDHRIHTAYTCLGSKSSDPCRNIRDHKRLRLQLDRKSQMARGYWPFG